MYNSIFYNCIICWISHPDASISNILSTFWSRKPSIMSRSMKKATHSVRQGSHKPQYHPIKKSTRKKSRRKISDTIFHSSSTFCLENETRNELNVHIYKEHIKNVCFYLHVGKWIYGKKCMFTNGIKTLVTAHTHAKSISISRHRFKDTNRYWFKKYMFVWQKKWCTE